MGVEELLKRFENSGIEPVEEIVIRDTPENRVRREEVRRYIVRLNEMHEGTRCSTLHFGPTQFDKYGDVL